MSAETFVDVMIVSFLALVALLVVLCNTGALRVLVGLFAS